jgi:hypothetical protein
LSEVGRKVVRRLVHVGDGLRVLGVFYDVSDLNCLETARRRLIRGTIGGTDSTGESLLMCRIVSLVHARCHAHALCG